MSDATSPDPAAAKWRPLSAIDRRIVGVLVEKAKTTPEGYPMTLNSLRTGANQKSNRFPQMTLEPEDVEESLERLRKVEVVTEIVGDGRVSKYRHRMYEWLGVDKVELAVMTELLLRGAQTIGELRGRAARMEPIADLGALQPILQSLKAKNLIVFLTPPGRGAVVTHNLYQPNELDRIKKEFGGAGRESGLAAVSDLADERPSALAEISAAPLPASDPVTPEWEIMQRELADLRTEMHDFRSEVERTLQQLEASLNDLRSQLGI